MSDLKRPQWGRWLARLVLVVAVAFALLNVLAYRYAYSMTHFVAGAAHPKPAEQFGFVDKVKALLGGVPLPRPHSNRKVADLGAGAKSFLIDGDGSVKLGAWYRPGPPLAPLVILFHGYAGEKTSMLAEAKVFEQLGCAVLLVDFRGSGESSESYTTVGYVEGEDVAAAVRYAREKLFPSKVILYGNSMGAAAILRAVHDCGVRPDAIIAEAVFDNLLNTVRHRFELMHIPPYPGAELLVFWGGKQAGFNGFDLSPVNYAASVTCPILFLHGVADSRARLDEARRVFAAVPGSKQFKSFPGVEHVPILNRFPKEWKEAVRQFLTQVILNGR